MDDADGKVLMHLKVKMRRIKAMGIPDGPYLLAASNLLTFSHNNPVKMRIERIRIFHLPFFHENVPDDDYVAPCASKISGERDDPVANRINRIAKVRSAAPLTNPVFAEMSVRCETARNPITVRIGFADRIIKAICQSCQRLVWICQSCCCYQAKHDKEKRLFAHAAWFLSVIRTPGK